MPTIQHTCKSILIVCLRLHCLHSFSLFKNEYVSIQMTRIWVDNSSTNPSRSFGWAHKSSIEAYTKISPRNPRSFWLITPQTVAHFKVLAKPLSPLPPCLGEPPTMIILRQTIFSLTACLLHFPLALSLTAHHHSSIRRLSAQRQPATWIHQIACSPFRVTQKWFSLSSWQFQLNTGI